MNNWGFKRVVSVSKSILLTASNLLDCISFLSWKWILNWVIRTISSFCSSFLCYFEDFFKLNSLLLRKKNGEKSSNMQWKGCDMPFPLKLKNTIALMRCCLNWIWNKKWLGNKFWNRNTSFFFKGSNMKCNNTARTWKCVLHVSARNEFRWPFVF